MSRDSAGRFVAIATNAQGQVIQARFLNLSVSPGTIDNGLPPLTHAVRFSNLFSESRLDALLKH